MPFNPFDFGRPPFFTYGNLVAARLHEEAGDTAAALAALRRRVIGNATYPHYVRYRQEEGRLAASLVTRRARSGPIVTISRFGVPPSPGLGLKLTRSESRLAELLRAAGRH